MKFTNILFIYVQILSSRNVTFLQLALILFAIFYSQIKWKLTEFPSRTLLNIQNLILTLNLKLTLKCLLIWCVKLVNNGKWQK